MSSYAWLCLQAGLAALCLLEIARRHTAGRSDISTVGAIGFGLMICVLLTLATFTVYLRP